MWLPLGYYYLTLKLIYAFSFALYNWNQGFANSLYIPKCIEKRKEKKSLQLF